MFVYDGSSLPGTKQDARPLTGPVAENLQASEFNAVVSASYDLRLSIVSGSYIGYLNNSTASLPPLETGRTRMSGSNLQFAAAGTGAGYRDIPLLDSGSLTVVSLTASNARIDQHLSVAGVVTGSGGFKGNLPAGFYVLMNGPSWGIWTNSGDLTMNFTAGNVTALSINSAAGRIIFSTWAVDINGALTGTLDILAKRLFVQPSSTTVAGSATVNKPAGRSAISAGQSSVRIINNLVKTGSFVHVTPENWDPTLINWAMSASAGFFDVSGSAAATRDWKFNWQVIGSDES